MKRIEGSHLFPKDVPMPALALGNFDGVHLGHQKLIRKIKDEAKATAGTSVVYTFDPHPVSVLSPSQCPKLINTLEQKLSNLEASGVNITVVEKFTHEFSRQEPKTFFKNIIIDRMHPRTIIVGYDYTFGLHRHGTIETLEKLGKKNDIRVIIVPAAFSDETLISSTVIRRMIVEGSVEQAATLLGRPYEIAGKVVAGLGIGRTLAARTANIISENEIMPSDGVYITMTAIEDEILFPSITNIGDNPTIPESSYSIETHIIDKDLDILGKNITVSFLTRMREELRFATLDELKAQIARDIDEAREYHRQQGEKR
ncbi:MAG: bifunctional riboflavin kinase/FAD synthetase [Pseudomonadota bacterium]